MKTKSKHTPGPWSLHYRGRGASTVFSGSVEVATIKGSSAYNVPEDPGERSANALLIANAPDLLHALEEVMIELNNHAQYSDDYWETCHLHKDTVALVKKAIAKAMGDNDA